MNSDGVVDILDRHFDGELQKLAVLAVSDNADIVPDPQVIYVSPNGTAILNFTNNKDRFGTIRLTCSSWIDTIYSAGRYHAPEVLSTPA